MMIDAGEGVMSDRIARGGVVSSDFKTIFPNQIRPARQAIMKSLCKRIHEPVLRGLRGLSVLNALEVVACDRGKSREPVISNRQNIVSVEVIGTHVLRANIGGEIRLRLVSGVHGGVQGQPCRDVMRERQSDISILIVCAQIEKLGKASDTK